MPTVTFRTFQTAKTEHKVNLFFTFNVDQRLFYAYRRHPAPVKSIVDVCASLHKACSINPQSDVTKNLLRRVRYVPELQAIVYLGAFVTPLQNDTFKDFSDTTGTKFETLRRSVLELCKKISFRFYTFTAVGPKCIYAHLERFIAYSAKSFNVSR